MASVEPINPANSSASYSIITPQTTLLEQTTLVDLVTSFTNATNNTNFTRGGGSPVSGEVLIPLYTIIFILSVVGNSLVIVTLIQNERMRTVTNVFLLNLSISDLLLAVFCMPFSIIPILLRNFIFGSAMCPLIRYLQCVSVAVSVFTLVAISLERYFAICRPLQSRSWQTLSHSYKIIASIWLLGFIIMIPMALVNRTNQMPNGKHKCEEIWDPYAEWKKVFTLFLDVIMFLLPLVVMLLAYGLIAYTLWKGIRLDMQSQQELKELNRPKQPTSDEENNTVTNGSNRAKNGTPKRKNKVLEHSVRRSNSEKGLAAKKRVIKMLFVIVLEFFICWMPLYTVNTWVIFDEASARQHVTPSTWAIMLLVSYVSSCCNPITYCFMNKNFRQTFLAAFCCGKGRRLRRSGTGAGSEYSQYGSPRTVSWMSNSSSR